jgi:cyclohexanone monooxygenase
MSDIAAPADSDLGFDPETLHAKYLRERDKRLRADGTDQYVATTGAFTRYLDDPYVAQGFSRAALFDEVEVVVIGGGFGGMLAAARLAEAGVEDVRILEKGGDFGGTWYWNRYPGAQCDIESYIYLPLLEELGYMPTEKYAHAQEILAHSQAIGRHFGLYDKALFQTEVTELRWDEAGARWLVSTNRGDAIRARFVVMSTGPLHRPKLPGIPGIESYRGHAFHTSRWDYAYTGGDADGGLDRLKDKRVGIIGTGATAVQCVPHLGASARELYVFQRTPSSIDVRNNRPTDPEWARALQPGWQQHRMENFNSLVSGGFEDEDLVSDGWTDIIRSLGRRQVTAEEAGEVRQLADFQKMEQIRARVDCIVRDPITAEALKPYYNQFCKRPCFHDDYLATFNRPNVTLVDTRGRGVEAVTERGVVAGGREYELDCLIYATGFEFGTEYARRSGYEIYGRGGVTQTQKWKDGVSTLRGMHSRGFPNCFILGNAQSANTPNFPHMLTEASQHIAAVIKRCSDRQARTVEPSAEAEAAWVEAMLSFAEMRRAFDQECTPGYYNNEGQPSTLTVRNGFYGGGSVAFIRMLREWRTSEDLSGLEFGQT